MLYGDYGMKPQFCQGFWCGEPFLHCLNRGLSRIARNPERLVLRDFKCSLKSSWKLLVNVIKDTGFCSDYTDRAISTLFGISEQLTCHTQKEWARAYA